MLGSWHIDAHGQFCELAPKLYVGSIRVMVVVRAPQQPSVSSFAPSTTHTAKDAKRLAAHKQTRLCKFFAIGACTKGTACPFAHGTSHLRALIQNSERFLMAVVQDGMPSGLWKRILPSNITFDHHEDSLGTITAKRHSLRYRWLTQDMRTIEAVSTPTEEAALNWTPNVLRVEAKI